MVAQIWLAIRMAIYPLMGAVVWDGFTSFDPETGAYTILLPQIAVGVIGYVFTFVASRFSSAK